MIDYTGTTPKSYIYVLDVHGSVIGLADDSESTQSSGVVINYEYDVWGNLLNIHQTVLTGNGESLADANPVRYCGYQFDKETGFYYLKYRYYVPSLGRFLTRDPMMTGNRYVYCRNNPVNFVDPLGLISRPNISARPRPRINRPVIYYHAGAAFSDARRRNNPNIGKSVSGALSSPDIIPGIISDYAKKRVLELSNLSEGLSPRALYKLAFKNADEMEIFSSGAKAASSLGRVLGVGGSLVGGYVSIHEDINNPLYSEREEKIAVGIDSAATVVSIISVFALPFAVAATAPIWVGVGDLLPKNMVHS